MAMLTNKFERTIGDVEVEQDQNHHEVKNNVQKSF